MPIPLIALGRELRDLAARAHYRGPPAADARRDLPVERPRVLFLGRGTGAFSTLLEGTTVAAGFPDGRDVAVDKSPAFVVVIVLLIPATAGDRGADHRDRRDAVVVSVAGSNLSRLEKRNGGHDGRQRRQCDGRRLRVRGAVDRDPAAVFTVIGAVLLPAANSAFLNQGFFRYDALSEHASGEEYGEIAAQPRTGCTCSGSSWRRSITCRSSSRGAGDRRLAFHAFCLTEFCSACAGRLKRPVQTKSAASSAGFACMRRV